MKRSCQRHTTDLLLPVRRMISAVPKPSAVSKTIRARQTWFCGLFRLATIAASRRRSAALTSTTIPVRISKTRTAASLWESRGDSYVRLEPLVGSAACAHSGPRIAGPLRPPAVQRLLHAPSHDPVEVVLDPLGYCSGVDSVLIRDLHLT